MHNMFKVCTYTFLSVLAVDLLAATGDITLTWTSPILPKLHSVNQSVNPLGFPISLTEESWIGSLINIGALIGPLPFGLLSKKLGRKISLLCVSIPYIFSFLILAFLHNIYWYYFARLLAGISVGAGSSLLPMYITEIAEDSNRGMLSVTLAIFWSLGNLIPYILGPYMSIMWFNVALLCIPLLFVLLFLMVGHETPYFLIEKGKIAEAEKSLMKLRSGNSILVKKEIMNIQRTLKQDESANFLDLFKTKANLKALGISVGLLTFQQLSGINAVLFYTQLIFEVAGSQLAPEIASIVIGMVLFISSFIVPFFADRIDRRILMISACLGMMVSLILLGTYFYLKETLFVDTSSFQFMPILSLVLFIIFYNWGFATLPWTVSSELFSINMKPFGIAITSLTCWLVSFVVTKFFSDLNLILGQAGTFWLFGTCCFISALFILVCVPETRGKSFQDIQKLL